MRKVLAVVLLGLSLSGCAFFQKIEGLYQEVSGSTISPQNVYLVANAFDAAKAAATQYFVFCKTHQTVTACSADNRRLVLKGVRAGTAARNQLETYLVAGTPAPRQIYDTLSAIVASLQSSAIGAAQ